jgi:hypothetical protein
MRSWMCPEGWDILAEEQLRVSEHLLLGDQGSGTVEEEP